MTYIDLDKFIYVRSKKIRDSARGEECTLQGPTCNHDPQTTVYCHLNLPQAGKGMGIKASDAYGFYGCSNCHAWYDGTRDRQLANHYALHALVATQQILKKKGLVHHEE